MDSDHKPVVSLFHIHMAVADESERRRCFGEIISDNAEVRAAQQAALSAAPTVSLSTTYALLSGNQVARILLRNQSRETPVLFSLTSEGPPKEGRCGCGLDNHGYVVAGKGPKPSGGFPVWLEVRGEGRDTGHPWFSHLILTKFVYSLG